MPSKTVVVALGGNALGNSVQEQLDKTRIAAKAAADLVEAGYKVVVTHGNGPQVGLIKKCFDTCELPMPLAECSAMSQGYIGYHLQQTLQNEFKARKIQKSVTTVLTQVVVDRSDLAFDNPSKPIGAHYTETIAQKLMAESSRLYKEDAGRGWRWVVPSPKPIDICEKDTIKLLLNEDRLVIACGGGGIPVIEKDGFYQGIDAVIDKDYAAAKLADLIEADFLLILTAVDRVSLNYGQFNEKALERITVAEAEEYIKQGHFYPGSMLPKIEAGILFAKGRPDRKAVIGSIEKSGEILAGHSGTVITEYL